MKVIGGLSEKSAGCLPGGHAGGWPGPVGVLSRLVLPNSRVHAYGWMPLEWGVWVSEVRHVSLIHSQGVKNAWPQVIICFQSPLVRLMCDIS